MSTKLALSKKPAPKQTTFIKPKKSKQEDGLKSPMFGNQSSLIQSRNHHEKDLIPIKKSSISYKRQGSQS